MAGDGHCEVLSGGTGCAGCYQRSGPLRAGGPVLRIVVSRTPVPTPHCYYSHLDSETGFALLVLEDLARARNGKSIAGCSVDEVTRVLLPSPGCMRRGGSCGAGQRDVAAPAVPGCARSHGGYLQPGLAILSPKVEYPRDPPDQRDGGLDRTEPSGRRDDLVRLRPSDAHPLRRASGQPVLR